MRILQGPKANSSRGTMGDRGYQNPEERTLVEGYPEAEGYTGKEPEGKYLDLNFLHQSR